MTARSYYIQSSSFTRTGYQFFHDMSSAVSGWVNGAPVSSTITAVSVTGGFPQAESGGVLTPSGVPGGAGCSVIVPMIGGTDYVQCEAWSSTSATTDVATPGLYSFCEIVPVQTDLAG